MGDDYAQLTQIAPTVAVDYVPQVEWKSDERQLGRLFDDRPRIEKALADFEGRIAEFKTAMGPRSRDTEVSFIRLMADEIRVHTRFHFAGNVLEEAGLKRPTAVRNGRVHVVDPTHWLIGGVRAADLALTDLFRYVVAKG